MYQVIYASISHTHYWHEVGMLYLFTMVVAPTCKDTLFLSVLHHYMCIRVRAMCEYQQNTCTAVNMHSGKVRWMHSHPAAETFNVHAPKSLCCLKKNWNAPRPSEHPPVHVFNLLFHCFTGKGAKTNLHQEFPHGKK